MESRFGAKWIWQPQFRDFDTELPGRFVLFRKSFDLSERPKDPCEIHVSADTRYRLLVNGVRVAFGPCKSYPTQWYYETIDISSYLRAGSNVIAAKVLRFFPDQAGSSSLMRTNLPGFVLWGNINGLPIITDDTWLCCEDRSVRIQPRSRWNYILGPPFLSLDEQVDFATSKPDWHTTEADVSSWSAAVPAYTAIKMMPAMEPWKLFERPIPMLPETPEAFVGALKCSSGLSLQQWNDLLCKQQSLTVSAGETVTVEFESAVLTTAFLEFDFVGGSGSEITILYAESYEQDLGKDKAPFPLPRSKTGRRNWEDGRLYGNEDHITLAAVEGQPTQYEPFWFRTFRFIRLQIVSKAIPVTIKRIAFRETHYPLDITTELKLPAELNPVWDICVRTLRNCMHETYEDCPFYEQNQFAMDGRLQLLFTYQLSRDDRLARKTIHEFYASRRSDGLIETNFPVTFRAINIPQFSLFWILMLHDHMLYFGDTSLTRRYIGTADGILEYFDSLVNKDGLIGAFDPECWAFIDWVKEWQGSKGIRDMANPPVYKATGIAAYNSLIYAWTLQHAADLCDFINRSDTAIEYRKRAESLNQAVRTHCFNGTFFTDGPGTDDISEHTQVFAVLSGAISGSEAADLIKRTMDAPATSMPRCSYAMKHYLFRALEKTGLYDAYFEQMMAPWHKMIENNLTTCPEDDVSFRSDCHGWSASPIYEFVAIVYGVRPGSRAGTGVQVESSKAGGVSVSPRRQLLPAGEAKVRFSEGEVDVRWEESRDVEVRINGDPVTETVVNGG